MSWRRWNGFIKHCFEETHIERDGEGFHSRNFSLKSSIVTVGSRDQRQVTCVPWHFPFMVVDSVRDQVILQDPEKVEAVEPVLEECKRKFYTYLGHLRRKRCVANKKSSSPCC